MDISKIRSKTRTNAIIASLLASFIAYFTSSGMCSAMLEMKRALHIGLVPMEWTITIFTALAASSITIGGQYGDIFGRLKVFLYGIIIYFICSILLSIGTDLTIVMLGSVLRGIGGGFIVSGSLSVLKTLAGPKKLNFASTLWVIGSFAGYFFGCLFGGLFAQFVDWRMLYWVCLPPLAYCIVSIYLGIKLENFKPKRHIALWKQVDYFGTFFLAIFAISIVLIFSEGNYWGWGSPILITLYAICPLAFIILLISQKYLPNPLIKYSVILRWEFFVGLFAQLACYAIIYPVMFFINFYSQSPVGYNNGAFLSSIYLLPFFGVIPFVNLLAKYCTNFIKVYRLLLIGLCFLFAGIFTLFFFHTQTLYANLWWRLIIIGIGLGISLPTAVMIALNNTPKENIGMASGVLTLMNFLGATLSISLGSMVYSSQLTKALANHSKSFSLSMTKKLQLLDAIHDAPSKLNSVLSEYSASEKSQLFKLLHDGSSNGLASVGLVCTIFAAFALGIAVIYKIKVSIIRKN